MRKRLLLWGTCGEVLLMLVLATPALAEREVVINEIAWMGTAASPFDEWIELKNNTDQEIDLTGWRLVADDASPEIMLEGTIPADSFYLLERSDDLTVGDIEADLIYAGGLSNAGEVLRLFDGDGHLIDTANLGGRAWYAGAVDGYVTMERVDPEAADIPENWASNDGAWTTGLDTQERSLRGTPKAENSATVNN
ncbi:MAG: lamin tail domain-containing protein [Candidatus Bipolaricaulia bacterium]